MVVLRKLFFLFALMSALTIGAVGCGDDNGMEEAGDEVGETMEEAGEGVEQGTD